MLQHKQNMMCNGSRPHWQNRRKEMADHMHDSMSTVMVIGFVWLEWCMSQQMTYSSWWRWLSGKKWGWLLRRRWNLAEVIKRKRKRLLHQLHKESQLIHSMLLIWMCCSCGIGRQSTTVDGNLDGWGWRKAFWDVDNKNWFQRHTVWAQGGPEEERIGGSGGPLLSGNERRHAMQWKQSQHWKWN